VPYTTSLSCYFLDKQKLPPIQGKLKYLGLQYEL